MISGKFEDLKNIYSMENMEYLKFYILIKGIPKSYETKNQHNLYGRTKYTSK